MSLEDEEDWNPKCKANKRFCVLHSGIWTAADIPTDMSFSSIQHTCIVWYCHCYCKG